MKRKLLAMITALAMVLAMMPAMALAEEASDDYVQISLSDCTKIGTNDDMEADIYYYDLGDNGTKIQFSDLEMEEDGIMSGILTSSGYVYNTNKVDLGDVDLGLGLSYSEFLDGIGEKEGYKEYLDMEICKDLDFSNIYGLFVMDDDYEMYYFIIQGAPRYFSTDTGQLTGVDKDAVEYQDWSDYSNMTIGHMDQYHVAIPAGTDQVELSFWTERICYAYDKNGEYLYSCGEYGDGSTGSKTATVKRLEDGSMPYCIYVQTPYENMQSEFLYAVSFEDYTFEASYKGNKLTDIEYTPDAYSYYDYIKKETCKVGVYTVVIPREAKEIDFSVSGPVLHYNYTKEGEYLGGAVADPSNGDVSFSQAVDYGDDVTAADGEMDYIQFQVPYDSSWRSLLLYAVTFKYEEEPTVDPSNENKDKAADEPKVTKGKTYKVAGNSYKVTKVAAAAAGTVTFTKAAGKKSVKVPKTVKLADGKTYKVTQVGAKAFTAKKIKTVTIGANVSKLAKKAFAKSKVKTLVLKTKKLKKASVKGSLKGSKVKTVKVKVGSKKVNKKYVKKYKKIFTKKNAGKKVKIK